jgi:hypothetical protein
MPTLRAWGGWFISGAIAAHGGSSLSFSSIDITAARTVQAGSYQLDDAVGGWSTTGSAPSQWVKPDHSGSMYDPVALIVEVDRSEIPEEETAQAAVHLVCDDASRLPPPAPVSYSVLSGPMIPEPFFVLRAEPVYRDSNATVQVVSSPWLTTINLLIVNTDPDNFGMFAGDDVADDWQVDFFTVGNPDGTADQDPDGDGYDNRFEFTAGTDPTSAADRFDIALHRTTGAEILFGPVQTGRTYRVESSDTLASADWFPLTGLVAHASSPVAALPDLRPDVPARHYRVWIDYPWRTAP